jgi:hypothetical protein
LTSCGHKPLMSDDDDDAVMIRALQGVRASAAPGVVLQLVLEILVKEGSPCPLLYICCNPVQRFLQQNLRPPSNVKNH